MKACPWRPQIRDPFLRKSEYETSYFELYRYLRNAADQLRDFRQQGFTQVGVVAGTSALLSEAMKVAPPATPKTWQRFVESAYQDLQSAESELTHRGLFGSTGNSRIADAEAKIKTVLGELHMIEPTLRFR